MVGAWRPGRWDGSDLGVTKVGFRPPRKLFMLVFPEDSELHGLEITCRSSTLGERRVFLEEHEKYKDRSAMEGLRYRCEFFLQFVTDWNLTDDDGNEAPKTYESLEQLDFEWIGPILDAYMSRSLGQKVSDDTEKKSDSGDSTETTLRTEASLPMEPLP